MSALRIMAALASAIAVAADGMSEQAVEKDSAEGGANWANFGYFASHVRDALIDYADAAEQGKPYP